VLASASPRRAALLEELGVPFLRRPAEVDETPAGGETPPATAERLALDKARCGARPEEDALVVGADTVVVRDGELLGKPADDDEARRMLRSLSGRSHEVLTGVAVVRTPEGAEAVGHARTEVRFRDLGAEDLDALVESGEGLDKAGAYGIQGLASLAVAGIRGDYSNVVGLPLGLLRRLIREVLDA
jgi:septum formation protein